MPLSPAVIYVREGQARDLVIGSQPSAGFIKLCQTGKPDDRAVELKSDKGVRSLDVTNGPILPGESKDFTVEIDHPNKNSLHFEAMYGKTKDVCAVGDISGHNLYAIRSKVVGDYFTRDNIISSGAFLDPAVTSTETCAAANDAVSCLRELAIPNTSKQVLHFFSGYLPSVVDFLEFKYGAADVQTLLIPNGGAAQLRIQLKH